MKNTIKEELQQFEKEYGIKIISARDTGSRAWNLESEESDYDVSFIYMQDFNDYLSPKGYKQNIDRESQTGHDIEYNSWNLDRFLELLSGSNPAAIEFLQSQKTYYENHPDYMQNLARHSRANFKPLALMMHHHNLAKNQYKRYLEQRKDPTIKRHLYAIRSLMYREYVKKEREVPSINFPSFYYNNRHLLKGFASHESEIRRMIEHKQKGRGDKTVNSTRIADKIGENLQDKIADEEKPDYTQQEINRDYLTEQTRELIKETNKNEESWKQKITSTLKDYTTN